jgi:hypothetical protein
VLPPEQKVLPVAIGTNAQSLLAAITSAASLEKMDVAKVERLFAMHQIVLKQEAEAAFNDAMAKTQAEIQPIVNNATNSHTRSSYAKLSAIDTAITPIHTKYGLSISYDTETRNDADPIPDGMLRTVAIVSHAGGHSRRHHIDLPPDSAGSQGTTNKTMVQARGSTNGYARRYLKLMIFNVSTFDDNDGNGANRKREPAATGTGKPEEGAPPFYPQADFVKNLPTWKKLMEGGKKTAEQIIATVGSKHRLSEDQLQKIRAAARAPD